LPEKSSPRACAADAADAAASPALRAPLAAVCCRPRALPPAFAARLRAGLLADEPDRAVDVERRLLELPEPERAVDLRAVDPELRELALDFRAGDFRVLDPVLRELALLRELDPRALDPDALREDPPLDALLRDDEDPLPLPLFDSAIALLLRSFAAAPQVRAALSHAHRRGDVTVVRRSQRATLAEVHLAFLGRRLTRGLHHVESAREQVVDRVVSGGRRQVEAPRELLKRLGLAAGPEVEVAPEEQRQVARPLHRALGGAQHLIAPAGHGVDAAVQVGDREHRAVRPAQPSPQHPAALWTPGQGVLAHLLDPPWGAHEQLVRAALRRRDQVRVQVGKQSLQWP
jgi:hypothetical protein